MPPPSGPTPSTNPAAAFAAAARAASVFAAVMQQTVRNVSQRAAPGGVVGAAFNVPTPNAPTGPAGAAGPAGSPLGNPQQFARSLMPWFHQVFRSVLQHARTRVPNAMQQAFQQLGIANSFASFFRAMVTAAQRGAARAMQQGVPPPGAPSPPPGALPPTPAAAAPAAPGAPAAAAPASPTGPLQQTKPNKGPAWWRKAKIWGAKAGRGLGNFASGMNTAFDPDAMVAQGQNRKGWKGHAQQAAGHAGGALAADDTLGTLAKGSKALGSLGSMIPVIGPVVGGLGKIGEVTFGTTGKLKKWGDNLHEQNMRFAEYSGQMAQVAAEHQAREIELKRSQGDARSESADYLARAKSRLDNAAAPLGNSIAKLKNYIAGGLTNALAWLTEKITGVKDKDKLPGEGNVGGGKWAWETGQKMWWETKGKPKRFN